MDIVDATSHSNLNWSPPKMRTRKYETKSKYWRKRNQYYILEVLGILIDAMRNVKYLSRQLSTREWDTLGAIAIRINCNSYPWNTSDQRVIAEKIIRQCYQIQDRINKEIFYRMPKDKIAYDAKLYRNIEIAFHHSMPFIDNVRSPSDLHREQSAIRSRILERY